MLYVDLTEDSVPVIRQHKTAHWIKKHFKHRLGSERCADDIGHGFRGTDVCDLGFTAFFALGVLVDDHDGDLVSWDHF
jgi:hypothetical protein